MRKLLLPFSLLITTLLSCNPSVNGQTPSAVKKTFAKMYPGENDPDWHLDKNGNYESNFKIDGIKYRADFAPNGKWIETENTLSKKELPHSIKELIEQKYKNHKIVEIERVEHHSKGLFYDVEFKKDGKKFDVEFQIEVNTLNENKNPN